MPRQRGTPASRAALVAAHGSGFSARKYRLRLRCNTFPPTVARLRSCADADWRHADASAAAPVFTAGCDSTSLSVANAPITSSSPCTESQISAGGSVPAVGAR